ncbi:MAG: molecular chaperone HtpG [Gammaproteobacteria bacterium]|nr:molecular chaperone HtpG [Gammaproteobacteria bacterium]MCF6231467.1 molecular chaperone HtpG [Gammaproteobacteria bacterium]
MTVESQKETLSFQTEVSQLLKLMIHSLYSNKEIFMRELISNASDAIDKLRFESLADEALLEGDSDLKIRIAFDKEARTITVSDNGIGMSRQEVMDNIGTIAKSGTRQFIDSLTGDQSKDSNLIGQFGVGFYSSFIVADKVSLTTRRAGTGEEHGVCWTSSGEGDYTLENVEKSDRGTTVVLHLREGEDDFLEDMRLRTLIRKYSDHIPVSIEMLKIAAPSSEEDENEAPVTEEYETVNSASALWIRPKSEISEEEYNEFYKHVAHDYEDPLAHSHNRVEGRTEYTSLLYIPARAPFDLWDREARHGIKLYVQRVFIMDDAEHLMPSYLRFIRGVIDSNDLPLNVSREILQHNKTIDSMRAGSVKKILDTLQSIAKNDEEKYTKFWSEFGNVMKEGPAEDHANQQKIAKLLRFATTEDDSADQKVALDQYIERMKEGQEAIYYITADTHIAAKNSPHLEVFRKKGIEVLLLSDRVDEWLVSSLQNYADKPLQAVTRGELNLGDVEDEQEKEQQKVAEENFKELVENAQKTLADKVSEVRITHRLTNSPACLVTGEHDMNANLERILKAAGQNIPSSKPILELNPEHPLIIRLKSEEGERFDELSNILFDQALLSEGGQLEDPAGFVQRLNKLLMEMSTG